MIKARALVACEVHFLTSTLCPPVISAPRPSPFSATLPLLCFSLITLKSKQRGEQKKASVSS